MKKTPAKKTQLVELKNRKLEAQKTETSTSFGKFIYKKPRNTNNSNVGASWGPRKGN